MIRSISRDALRYIDEALKYDDGSSRTLHE